MFVRCTVLNPKDKQWFRHTLDLVKPLKREAVKGYLAIEAFIPHPHRFTTFSISELLLIDEDGSEFCPDAAKHHLAGYAKPKKVKQEVKPKKVFKRRRSQRYLEE